MKQVGVYQAKTQLPRLLDEVEQGETFVITRHGRPVARLVPMNPRRLSVGETIAAIHESRKGNRLAGLSMRDLVGERRQR